MKIQKAKDLKEIIENKGRKIILPYILTTSECDNGDESLVVYGGIEISSESMNYDKLLSSESLDSLMSNLPSGHRRPGNQIEALTIVKNGMKKYVGEIGEDIYHHMSEEHPKEKIDLKKVQEVSKPDFNADDADFIDDEDIEILFKLGHYKVVLSQALKK